MPAGSSDLGGRLQALDRRLQSESTARLTLDPTRASARLPSSILCRQVRDTDGDAMRRALVAWVETLVDARLTDFPHNLFGDMDCMVARVAEDARHAADPIAHLGQVQDLLCRLYRTFGCRSVIRFRYVHDFVYGLDWGRWVRRDPEQRADNSPMHPWFLRHLLTRGEQITELIHAGDARYPRLDEGEFRNPYPFSRTPEAELLLFRDLAARDLLPVQAWNADGHPRFWLADPSLRLQRARALGLVPVPGDGH